MSNYDNSPVQQHSQRMLEYYTEECYDVITDADYPPVWDDQSHEVTNPFDHGSREYRIFNNVVRRHMSGRLDYSYFIERDMYSSFMHGFQPDRGHWSSDETGLNIACYMAGCACRQWDGRGNR